MAKAVLIVGALCAVTVTDAFIPTCPRSISSAKGVCADSRLGRSLPFGAVVKPTDLHIARTQLFSAPAASNEQAATPPVIPATSPVAKEKSSPGGILKVGGYFGLWYLFNIAYNIYNKRLLNALPVPWLMASAQLGIGLLYVFPLWLTNLRKAPKLAKGALGPLR